MENNNDNNTNNNNLFSTIFGVESEEQPIDQPVKDAPVVPQQPVMNQPVAPAPVSPQPMMQQGQPMANQQMMNKPIMPPQPVQEEIIVLDSNTPQVEQQPKVEVPEPINQLNNINTNITSKNNNDFDEDKNPKEHIYKTTFIVVVITLLIVVLAFPLYKIVNNSLNKPKTNDTSNQQTILEQEQPEEKVENPKVELNINFDMDLSFDKGYTNNKNEYHQTQSFKPEASEGIIKCESISPMKSKDGKNNTKAYIYYKDYMAKKLLTIDDVTLNNSTTYNQYLQSFKSITSVMSKNEHLFTKLLVDQSNYRINYYMLVDLAYSQATKIPDSDYYIYIAVSYNTPIKSAMNKFLGNKDYVGNIYCSTINTQDASL